MRTKVGRRRCHSGQNDGIRIQVIVLINFLSPLVIKLYQKHFKCDNLVYLLYSQVQVLQSWFQVKNSNPTLSHSMTLVGCGWDLVD